MVNLCPYMDIGQNINCVHTYDTQIHTQHGHVHSSGNVVLLTISIQVNLRNPKLDLCFIRKAMKKHVQSNTLVKILHKYYLVKDIHHHHTLFFNISDNDYIQFKRFRFTCTLNSVLEGTQINALTLIYYIG